MHNPYKRNPLTNLLTLAILRPPPHLPRIPRQGKLQERTATFSVAAHHWNNFSLSYFGIFSPCTHHVLLSSIAVNRLESSHPLKVLTLPIEEEMTKLKTNTPTRVRRRNLSPTRILPGRRKKHLRRTNIGNTGKSATRDFPIKGRRRGTEMRTSTKVPFTSIHYMIGTSRTRN